MRYSFISDRLTRKKLWTKDMLFSHGSVLSWVFVDISAKKTRLIQLNFMPLKRTGTVYAHTFFLVQSKTSLEPWTPMYNIFYSKEIDANPTCFSDFYWLLQVCVSEWRTAVFHHPSSIGRSTWKNATLHCVMRNVWCFNLQANRTVVHS